MMTGPTWRLCVCAATWRTIAPSSCTTVGESESGWVSLIWLSPRRRLRSLRALGAAPYSFSRRFWVSD